MTQPMFERVALVGIGLIGSSISHAMRRKGLAEEIVGSARTKQTLRDGAEARPHRQRSMTAPPKP